MSCSKNSCERISTRELKVGAQLVTHTSQCTTNGDGQYGEGCKLAVKCQEGYYLAESEYSSGQKIVCSNGVWIDEVKKVKTTVSLKLAECKPGCKVLSEDNPFELGNATFVGAGKPANIYKHDDLEYWSSGTVVETKCKLGTKSLRIRSPILN